MPEEGSSMYGKFDEMKKLMNAVQSLVEKNKYAFVVPEEMLYVLLSDAKVSALIKKLTNDADKHKTIADLKEEVIDYIEKNVGHAGKVSLIANTDAYTNLMREAFERGAMRMINPDSLCVFLSLFSDKDQACAYFLSKHGVYENDAIEYAEDYWSRHNGNGSSSGSKKMLEKYSINLNDMAKEGKIDSLVGREKEVERVIEILSRRKSSCPCLLGNAGVGKSAVVEGLAMKILNDEVPPSLEGKTIYAIDLTSMVAGTKFRGEFEERLTNVIKEAASDENCILFIDELHTIVGTGGSEGTMDSSNILKPYLSNGTLHVIGATTYDEYKNKIEKDKALSRRFKKVDINEPSKEDTYRILCGIREKYESFHGIKFSDDVMRYTIDLSQRFILGKYFPDKAIDVLDEIGARYRSGFKDGDAATREDVEEVICAMVNIPKLSLHNDEKSALKDLGDRIKKNLYGQDESVEKVVRQVRMVKSGLGDTGRPLSVLMLGPTGVGKTEFAKTLAKELNIGFTKLDMSEYREEYSVSKLIGSAAGYVGYENPGALTEPLIKNPHQVILLDEIEKANKSVFDLLLQVLDEGRLTDSHGREASFRNAIILMTSNVGYANAEKSKTSMGFTKQSIDDFSRKKEIIDEAYKKCFSPEFRNRLTDVFYFNPLDNEVLGMIVDKNLRRINAALLDKEIYVEISDDARKWFIEKAAAENAGGRPVERLIDTNISEKMADEVLFGELSESGGIAHVDLKDDAISIEFRKNSSSSIEINGISEQIPEKAPVTA